MAKEVKQLLRECSDKFHQISSSIEAHRLLRENPAMPPKMYEAISKKILTPQAISALCASGFEDCVRALAELGDTDVTIFECNPSEEPVQEYLCRAPYEVDHGGMTSTHYCQLPAKHDGDHGPNRSEQEEDDELRDIYNKDV